MNKFKIGDRVELLKEYPKRSLKKGTYGTVDEDSDIPFVKFDNGKRVVVDEEDLRLVDVSERPGNTRKQIINILKELNVPVGNSGFEYLITAIMTAAENMETLQCMAKQYVIYDTVAEKHHTTISRAERAIRHGIECAFKTMPDVVREKYFGCNVKKVTNRNFIATLVYEVKE